MKSFSIFVAAQLKTSVADFDASSIAEAGQTRLRSGRRFIPAEKYSSLRPRVDPMPPQ
jgi:hypothetical protein